MLASGRFDQAIEGVIGVVVVRLDDLAIEIDGLLRVVLNMGNIGDRVIGIKEVMEVIDTPYRLQMGQAEGFGIVVVRRPGAISILNQFALAFGVVVDIDYERCSLHRAAQVYVDLVEEIGFVEDGAIHAPVRRSHCYWTIERVVGRAAGEGLAFQRG